MKKNILIVTQAVDIKHPVLGFFVRWIEEFAKHADHIEVIALQVGEYTLPQNVTVHSLGKESKGRTMIYHSAFNRFVYAFRFLTLVVRLRKKYDSVFVHMNQEYILLAGWFWRLIKKPVYLWRNHFSGSWLTDVAVFLCKKVFCTSRSSYTAKFKKSVIMPVGVEIEHFIPFKEKFRPANSILYFSRITPAKRIEIFIEALSILKNKGIPFSASIIGSALPQDVAYHRMLKARVDMHGLNTCVVFQEGVSRAKSPDVFSSYEFFVNTSPSGMFDKMIFEAVACGCISIAASTDWKNLVGELYWFSDDPRTLADRLSEWFSFSPEERQNRTRSIECVIDSQSLISLSNQLFKHLY